MSPHDAIRVPSVSCPDTGTKLEWSLQSLSASTGGLDLNAEFRSMVSDVVGIFTVA
jgi:hypothetical protein